MGKNPSFQFYPGDWTRDLQEHALEIEGAWIRIICRLWWAAPPGTLEKPLKFWSDLLRIHGNKTLRILRHLDQEKIADIAQENGLIRITSRRMVNDEKIRQIRRKAGLLGGNPSLVLDKQKDKQTAKQNPTPSSSSSSSTSSINNIKKIEPPKNSKHLFRYCSQCRKETLKSQMEDGRCWPCQTKDQDMRIALQHIAAIKAIP